MLTGYFNVNFICHVKVSHIVEKFLCQNDYIHILQISFIIKVYISSLFQENAQLHILSFLDIKDLCRISCVCWHWNNIGTDNLLWRRRLERDVQSWNVVGYTTNPDMYQECQSDWSYKEM